MTPLQPHPAPPLSAGAADALDRADRFVPLAILEPRGEGERPARAVCPYCGVGCVLDAEVVENRVSRVAADPAVEPNRGMMCPKGALLSRVFDDPDRLTRPLLRPHRGAPLRPVAWDEALGYVAGKLKAIRDEHGPDALAWYGSGQLDTEASYVFTKLFKGFLGSNHTDTNSRLCMSSAVAGYRLAFGSDGPPTCYDDIEEADTFFILGANMAANHPVLFNRVRRRRATRGQTRVIVVDPRLSKTAEHADLHLPVAPGGDVALLQWIARRLLDLGQVDHGFLDAHTSDGRKHLAYLATLDPANLQERCGLERGLLDQAVAMVMGGRRLLSFYCMGANQSTRGTDKNTAIINLHLLLGQVGRPGCGPFSLTGQPNAMGGREVGYLSHQLPGYRHVERHSDRAEVERAWSLPEGSIDPSPGYAAVPMFEAAARGEIKALWIACTNPAVSMPDVSTAQRGLRETGLVVVQDITARSETVAYADVVFPACQWGEKSGTMTNSERLVVRSHRFLDAPGWARPDWWIAAQVGRAMGFHGFDFRDAEQVWDEYRRMTAGRPCDQSGMTNARLNTGPLRWPCRDASDPGAARRYTDLRFDTVDGKARMHTGSLEGPDESADDDFPLLLTTGRVAAQWHTRTKTALVPELDRQEPEPFVEIHPADAERCGVRHGRRTYIQGRRGRAWAVARVTDRVKPGVVFAPFHWGDAFEPGCCINAVTNSAADAVSQQPETKVCAVRLVPAPAGFEPDEHEPAPAMRGVPA